MSTLNAVIVGVFGQTRRSAPTVDDGYEMNNRSDDEKHLTPHNCFYVIDY